MVLLRVEGDANNTRIMLRDPNAAEDALLVIDQPRFEDIWSGDVILVKRNYEISDESQPFSFGLVAALIFRERRIVRDVAVSALVLGFLGLAPIMFWRLLSDKVIFYHAYNTFYVLCLAMAVIIAFEATFSFLRQVACSSPDDETLTSSCLPTFSKRSSIFRSTILSRPPSASLRATSAKCSAFDRS